MVLYADINGGGFFFKSWSLAVYEVDPRQNFPCGATLVSRALYVLILPHTALSLPSTIYTSSDLSQESFNVPSVPSALE